jgi:hypothetical protein
VYNREELVNIKSILSEQLNGLFPANEKTHEYFALTIGSIAGFILTYFGGIYGENYESYLFHSAIFPALLYFGLGYIKQEGFDNEFPAIIKNLLKYDFSLFIGFTLSILAKTIMIYGIYHIVSFIWIFPNITIMMAALVVRIVEKHKKDDYNLFFRRKSSDN